MIGTAADPRRLERDAHRQPLGTLDVVFHGVAAGHGRGQDEALVRAQELPIQEVLERATVDREQLRSRDDPECCAERARRDRLDTNHRAAWTSRTL